jgi:hypothetical protein
VRKCKFLNLKLNFRIGRVYETNNLDYFEITFSRKLEPKILKNKYVLYLRKVESSAVKHRMIAGVREVK